MIAMSMVVAVVVVFFASGRWHVCPMYDSQSVSSAQGGAALAPLYSPQTACSDLCFPHRRGSKSACRKRMPQTLRGLRLLQLADFYFLPFFFFDSLDDEEDELDSDASCFLFFLGFSSFSFVNCNC